MKKIKTIIIVLLVSFGLLFNGELYILYLDNIQDSFYQCTFDFASTSKYKSNEDIISDFEKASKKTGVDYFFIEDKNISAYEKEITLFGNERAIRYLKSNGIKEKKSGSLFFGKTTVNFKDLEEIEEFSEIEKGYFIGDKNKLVQMKEFKLELITDYGGSLPKLFSSTNKETQMNIVTVWGIVISIILILTLYEVLYMKKEIFIRMVLGEDVRVIFYKSVLTDIFVLTIALISLSVFLGFISNVYFKFKLVLLLLALLYLLVILMNSLILFVNYKRDTSNNINGKNLLSFNYVLKSVTTTLCILVISSNILLFKDVVDQYRQRDFFETHSEYEYFIMSYGLDNKYGKTAEDDEMMKYNFYRKFQKNSMQFIDLSENGTQKYPVILVNQNSFRYIKDKWPQIEHLEEKVQNEGIFILYPSNIIKESDEYLYAEEFLIDLFFDGIVTESFQYDKGISLTGIHKYDMYESFFYNNPILIYDNTTNFIDDNIAMMGGYYLYDTLYNISEEELNSFIEEYQLDKHYVVKSNAYEVYQTAWIKTLRSFNITVILTIGLIILESALILLILQMEYSINSIEMALKKIHGYSIFNRNKKNIKLTIRSLLSGILIAYVIGYQMKMELGWSPLIIGGLLLILEAAYIINKAKSIEKFRITTILKGEKV